MKNHFSLSSTLGCFLVALLVSACASTLPEERHQAYTFPDENVFIDNPTGKFADRPYETMGWVKAKAKYPTMEQETNSAVMCRNYYNKAARTLLRDAKKAKADAVIQVRSVVLTMDGKFEEYKTAECADDGAEGEVLLRGIAIKFKAPEKKGRRRVSAAPEGAVLAPVNPSSVQSAHLPPSASGATISAAPTPVKIVPGVGILPNASPSSSIK